MNMVEAVLRRESKNVNFQLHFYYLYRAAFDCQIILVYFYLNEQHDNSWIQLVLISVLVPAMMSSVLRLCRQLLYISVLRSLSLENVSYTIHKSNF